MSPTGPVVWVTKGCQNSKVMPVVKERNAPVPKNKSCGGQLAVRAVTLTALRALKLKPLSVNPALGLRGDLGKWFSFQKGPFS